MAIRRNSPQSRRARLNRANDSHDPDGRRASDEQVRKLANRRLLSAEIEDFMRYLHSPWRIILRNVMVGLARGLGAVFGATVIVAIAISILKLFIDIPLIGQYANQVRVKVNDLAEETRYSDDFERLQSTMERIDLRLKTQNELLEKIIESDSQP